VVLRMILVEVILQHNMLTSNGITRPSSNRTKTSSSSSKRAQRRLISMCSWATECTQS